MRFLAIKKYKAGGEATMEYFHTLEACRAWIKRQPQPVNDAWEWCVGEYAI